MLCEKCKKNNATFFFEENINGKKRSFALCPDCAAELKGTGEITESNSILDYFSYASSLASQEESLFGSLLGHGQKLSNAEKQKSCNGCGATFNDFRRTGKAGCPECYRTFSSELESTVKQIHGSASHCGRVPAKDRKKHAKENELKALKNALKEAISAEEFEKAAELRDKIRAMENTDGGEL